MGGRLSLMKKSSLLAGALCSALITAPIVAAAADLSPSTILSNAQSYDGQSVAVQGTITDFSTRQTRRGTVATYKICDQKCVDVLDPNASTQTNGNSVTINGTFHASINEGRQTYSNVIVIRP